MAARVSLTSMELNAAKACGLPTMPCGKPRDPQSGDLISVSFPATFATSDENIPATPGQIWKSAIARKDDEPKYRDTQRERDWSLAPGDKLGNAGRISVGRDKMSIGRTTAAN